MFKNYLRTILRGISKHKMASAINIVGLAIGIGCSLLILMYVQYELSYDGYHENVDRIYRVSLHGTLGGNDINAAATPYPMAAALENEFPEIEAAVRLRRFNSETLVSRNDTNFQETEVFHTDPTFFKIFSYFFINFFFYGHFTPLLTNLKYVLIF